MIIDRKLISDEVIIARITALQEQFLDAIASTHSTATDFIIDNNIKALETANEEQEKTLRANLETVVKNQENRILNIAYYEKQIEFLQSVLAKKDGFIEINETLKPF